MKLGYDLKIMDHEGSLTNCLTLGFRVLPNYGNDVRKQYNLLLAELAKGDLLAHIVSMILGRPVEIGKVDDALAKDVVNTNYALS